MDSRTSTQEGGPFNYERHYPYATGTVFEPMRMTLIVKGTTARFMFNSPPKLVDGQFRRLGNKYAATWTADLGSYKGGR